MSASTSTTSWKGFCHCGAVQFEVNPGCLEGADGYALEASVADGGSLSVVENA
ncbi:hypothetical protein [Paraburkholderia silvatlantica]|uniref:Glutathione-dependent formaldehyde-activating enzyme n=1 Tax=Paraburkholderia silvatlantica TaxID=321895 RepID=A0ABR6FJD5_9BURK|nr:hypothetical protein [Paraburkholderia silvatlantica]PVY36226.1 hypothetical protein C7411_10397 [Paraburkholderia silvatlantica]PXW40358.1 hypothetical protein C7413_104221 [Paraburkholderia silvatlantica]TDQ97524.1 hypothetical protein C7412_108162 [Paraburkholderia silvatlantica]